MPVVLPFVRIHSRSLTRDAVTNAAMAVEVNVRRRREIHAMLLGSCSMVVVIAVNLFPFYLNCYKIFIGCYYNYQKILLFLLIVTFKLLHTVGMTLMLLDKPHPIALGHP